MRATAEAVVPAAPMLRALLWDVDGTLAETERDGHLRAFNRAFEALHVPWRWSEQRYGELLAVAGGYERLLCDMAQRSEAPAGAAERAQLARRIHREKNQLYEEIVRRGELPLRPGVGELMEDCRSAGLAMAVVTTTGRANVAALLERHLGMAWRERFAALVCAEEAPAKKPDPLAYSLALDALRLTPRETLAVEDSPAGVEAARRCRVPVIVTRSHFFRDCTVAAALAVGPSLGSCAGWRPPCTAAGAGRITLEQIGRWHAAHGSRRVAER
jgi:HAD superfamily hydrolase (TIGR01509 family)